jgi:hypothetical protein
VGSKGPAGNYKVQAIGTAENEKHRFTHEIKYYIITHRCNAVEKNFLPITTGSKV